MPLMLLLVASLTAVSLQVDQTYARYQRKNQETWAKRSGLPLKTVHHLWRLASVYADEADDDSLIQNLDTDSFHARKQILLVTYAGETYYCLTLSVFQEHGKDFSLLWQATQTPDGHAFCGDERIHDDPRVWVNDDGDIEVLVPANPIGNQKAGALQRFTFKWTGTTFRLGGSTLR